MANNQIEIFNVQLGDVTDSITKLTAELKVQRQLFKEAVPNTPEFAKYGAEVKRLDSTIKTLNNTTKDQVNALGGINKSAKFAEGSYGELKQRIDAQKKALLELNVESEEFAATQNGLIVLQEKRIEIEKRIPSLFQERIKGAIDESNSLKALRAELKQQQSLALNGDGQAAARVAELKDKIDDLKEGVQTLQGSGVERLNTSFGLLNQGFQDFDADKIKTGFKGIGAAMSAIPIVLIIEGIKALIDNFDTIVEYARKLTGGFSAAEQAVTNLTKATEAETIVNQNLIKAYDREIALLEAQGVSDEKIIEVKKRKIAVEILEAENSLKLEAAKAALILSNDTLGDSIERLSARYNRLIGNEEIADALEKKIANDQKERSKESITAAREAAQLIADSRNALLVLDAQVEKKRNDNAKKKAEERKKIDEEAFKTQQQLEEEIIKNLEESEKKQNEIISQSAKTQEELERELIDNLIKINQDYYRDKIARLEADVMNVERVGGDYLQAQLDLLEAEREQELSNTELTAGERYLIEEKYIKKKQDLENSVATQQLNAAGNLTNSLADLSDSLYEVRRSNLEKGSDEDRRLAEQQFNSNKAFSIASALISGAVAVINASASTPYLPVGLAASIAASAATAASVAKIASTKFQYFEGGYTTYGNPTEEAESIGNKQFHKNEYVIPSRVLNTSEGSLLAQRAEIIRRGTTNPFPKISGFFDGGFTARQISQAPLDATMTQNNLSSVLQNLPHPIVRVSDIDKVKNSNDQAVNVSGL